MADTKNGVVLTDKMFLVIRKSDAGEVLEDLEGSLGDTLTVPEQIYASRVKAGVMAPVNSKEAKAAKALAAERAVVDVPADDDTVPVADSDDASGTVVTPEGQPVIGSV